MDAPRRGASVPGVTWHRRQGAQPSKVSRHRGETVVVLGIRCIDPGPGGFICEAAGGGQKLRLDASGLGGGTTEAIAEKLIGPCKGLAALSEPTCTFDVTFVPTGSGYENGVTIVHTPEIDMGVSRRR